MRTRRGKGRPHLALRCLLSLGGLATAAVVVSCWESESCQRCVWGAQCLSAVFLFQYSAFWSGVRLFDPLLFLLATFVWTTLPGVVYAFTETDLPDAVLPSVPVLYTLVGNVFVLCVERVELKYF